MTNNIELKKVSASYEHFNLSDVDFTIKKGEIVGFVGENGAGKTTTIKAILDLISLDSGQISVLSKDSVRQSTAIKKDIGVVLDDSFFYEEFKISEIEKIMKQIHKNWDSLFFNQLLADHNIDNQKTFKECSKGMQAKLRIFLALAHHPQILILDEPTTGLDPISRNDILDIFREFMDDDKSILFSSHITSDIDKIADRVILIHGGKIKLIEDQLTIDENYGILKLTHNDFAELGNLSFLAVIKKDYSVECLINNKQDLIREFPEFEITTPTIEDILLFLKKGVS